MKVVQGDLWNTEEHRAKNSLGLIVFVTTCGVIGRDGLVMGAGSAKEAKDLHPAIPLMAKDAIFRTGRRINGRRSVWQYRPIVLSGFLEDPRIGLFQTKLDFKDPASIALISESYRLLTSYAKHFPTDDIRLPFPGIGFGKLKPSEVTNAIVSVETEVGAAPNITLFVKSLAELTRE